MKRSLCSLVALGLLVGVTGPAMAQPSYSFTILDVPGSSKASAIALGINASGQIVGSYLDAGYSPHGFLLDNGRYITLDVPAANGLNASGQIVGVYFTDFTDHGFLLDQGSYTTLDVSGSTGTFASGINESGQIVGAYDDAGGRHGFLAIPVP
jgi:probable HAF family extracellular repeat protein